MGLIDKMNAKFLEGGRKIELKNAKRKLEQTIKQKRLVFLGDNQARYTDINGTISNYTFDELAEYFIEITGRSNDPMISTQDIKDILVELAGKHIKK